LASADGPLTLPELIVLAPTLERQLDAAFDTLSNAEGFEAKHHMIDLYGRCANCRS